MATPIIYCDEPPEIYEDEAGMFHIIDKSAGEVIVHRVHNRVNFSAYVNEGEKQLVGRRPRGNVTAIGSKPKPRKTG